MYPVVAAEIVAFVGTRLFKGTATYQWLFLSLLVFAVVA
jgi:hypothetical protein